MENYQKYLPVSPNDNNWGLAVLNVGFNSIKKEESYPSKNHPLHHYFNWNDGRILDEYQIIYISRGNGYFESASCKKTLIEKGSIIFLFPGEWHRFKPEAKTGWDEFWIGCKGTNIENIENHHYINRGNPVLQIGFSEQIIHLFSEIIENTKQEKMGYQFYITGMTMHLLGLIQYKTKQITQKSGDQTEEIIAKAQLMLREMMLQKVKIEKIPEELHISYAWFRKAFKIHTGISPKQYLLQLKIEKAKSMLADNSKTIKEIAFALHFESASFFQNNSNKKQAGVLKTLGSLVQNAELFVSKYLNK